MRLVYREPGPGAAPPPAIYRNQRTGETGVSAAPGCRPFIRDQQGFDASGRQFMMIV
jgi:hypothetical protein